MREAMATCAVGDDVYKDDPSVNKLQEEVAKLFGKEAALFVPSGTMGNLISLMVSCRSKGEGAIIGNLAHVYAIERGGMSALGGIHPLVLQN
jgi:threonine aldolase